MSSKRSRAAFEADLQAQQSPYVLFGTPLPPLDPEVRDDGSYVPVWKQEVRDERGRRRLHGAFTGGWSAGYFNTVGSKEGWTPATFVSSRADRRKDDPNSAASGSTPRQQRPEDFMDEEDLADAAEAQKLQTTHAFAGLGSDEDGARRGGGGLADIFRVRGETMGVKLLRRMGWKDGQGIGPKVRRRARLDVVVKQGGAQNGEETYLFAPDNVPVISLVRKLDRKGLGYEGESRLTPLTKPGAQTEAGGSSDEESGPIVRRPGTPKKETSSKFAKGGIGIGILNDTGSDDEDPYEIGPRISYNRVIGGSKKKKKEKAANPALRTAPVFISRKSALAQAGKNIRRCYDGRLPLDGFVFGAETNDDLASAVTSAGKYPPPVIPPGWKPSKQLKSSETSGGAPSSGYVSTADAAKASKLDPRARASLLGEAPLPGKSVFDFLSAGARDRLAAAAGKPNLPPGRGEVPEGQTPASEAELLRQIPELDAATAAAALARGAGGLGAAPYADDEGKRARYRAYLEYAAALGAPSGSGNDSAPRLRPPTKPPGTSTEDWLRELHEFRSCARIFKPMTGMMASRFTTASSTAATTTGAGDGGVAAAPPIQRPPDPAEEAARLGMYGAMTRSAADFYPSRLLCKRFGVRPPAHAQPEHAHGGAAATTTKSQGQGPEEGAGSSSAAHPVAAAAAGSGRAMTLDELMRQAQEGATTTTASSSTAATPRPGEEAAPRRGEAGAGVNAEVNEALEGRRAREEVLRAVFGDSSDEEEDGGED
ncbi:DUF1604-domain-containing protein [Durotheca rogersii]|uniref:DUF1604-domain-containing protein n=1 Tax=Durotheca rogersii TaxID=419775 RepID=UPI002220959C|nr:DUF1604-domain-containing protein [Durotheca rogersii]KAI5866103.1 DUF1604-domain-containing protein [Durotheca rogersii]